MRPIVEKVTSSIKGGVKAKLGQRTLILGANGIGKSAILNAAELAGTGKVSDIAGRALMAKDADLFMLAPPEADHVYAHAHLSEGIGMASWELRKGKRAKRTGPGISFPLREVRDALLGSAETARKWILEHGDVFTWTEVLAQVPVSLHAKLASLGGPTDSASALTIALEKSRAEVRTCNSLVKTLRSGFPPGRPSPNPQEESAPSTQS